MTNGPDAATPARPYMLTTIYSKQVVELIITAIIGSDTVATGHAGAVMVIDSKASVSLETTAPGPYTEAAVVLVADTIDSKVTIGSDIAATSDSVAVLDLIAEAETETAMHTALDAAAVYPDQIANISSMSAITPEILTNAEAVTAVYSNKNDSAPTADSAVVIVDSDTITATIVVTASSKAAVGSESAESIGLYAVTTIDSGKLEPVDQRAATASAAAISPDAMAVIDSDVATTQVDSTVYSEKMTAIELKTASDSETTTIGSYAVTAAAAALDVVTAIDTTTANLSTMETIDSYVVATIGSEEMAAIASENISEAAVDSEAAGITGLTIDSMIVIDSNVIVSDTVAAADSDATTANSSAIATIDQSAVVDRREVTIDSDEGTEVHSTTVARPTVMVNTDLEAVGTIDSSAAAATAPAAASVGVHAANPSVIPTVGDKMVTADLADSETDTSPTNLNLDATSTDSAAASPDTASDGGLSGIVTFDPEVLATITRRATITVNLDRLKALDSDEPVTAVLTVRVTALNRKMTVILTTDHASTTCPRRYQVYFWPGPGRPGHCPEQLREEH